MARMFDVAVTVKSAPNGCSQGFKEGDSWLIKNRTPEGMCLPAFGAMYRQIMTLRYGGASPFGEDKDVMWGVCPDPNHCLVYEAKRLRK